MTTQERISPVSPFKIDIIKEIKENGRVVFKHPVGSEIDFYEQELFQVFNVALCRLKGLFILLDDEDWDRFGYLGQILVEACEQQFYEMFHYIDKEIGNIFVQIVKRGQYPYRPGQVIGVSTKSLRWREGVCDE